MRLKRILQLLRMQGSVGERIGTGLIIIIGFIVGIADVAFIFLFEHFLPKNMILLKLFLLIGSSALALFLSLTYLPRQSKGEMPAWIANEYRHYIPVPIRGWVLQHL